MDKYIIISICLLYTNGIFAAFTPPTNAVSSVSVNSATNVLVAPTAADLLSANPEIFPTANIKTLTAGTGLTGTSYSVTAASTFAVNTSWLVDSWLNSLKRDFFIFVEMSPTPADKGLYDQKSTASANYFSYVIDGVIYRTVTTQGAAFSTFATNDKVYALRYWTDCEMKVIDKWGNILYFTSTIGLNFSDVKNLHPEITDNNPTIWFYGTYGYSTTGCYGIKTKFTNFNSSIGATIGGSNGVTGVWFYPDLNSTETRTVKTWTGYGTYSGTRSVVWGSYIREVFENPENTIIVWRQTTSQGELFNSNKFWRPVLPTYYGNLKEAN